MAQAFRIDSFVISSGMIHLRETSGNTPLPAGENGDGSYISIDELERDLQFAKANRRLIGRYLLYLRADAIDPAHGATFRNALVGHSVILDDTTDIMVVRT